MKPQANHFYFLRWFSKFLFLLSLVAMVCAGMIYSDILRLEERVLPETWEAMLNDQGVPQGLHFGLSLMVSISLALLAAVIYVGAALSERLIYPR